MASSTRAAVFYGAGLPIRLLTFSLPEPRGSEVLVEVLACTLCGSDLHSLGGLRKVPTPTILGHEILGRIVAFGADASPRDASGQSIRVGDRVTWAVVANCGTCEYCCRDLPQKCLDQIKYGHEAIRPGIELTGGLAGHVLLTRGTAIFRVPESLNDATACPANCATATVAAAIEAAGPIEGRCVVIQGAGLLGITAAAWCRSLGAGSVIVCDLDDDRLSIASRFGATRVTRPDELSDAVQAESRGRGVDVTLELSGAPEAFESALKHARLGGSIVLVGAVFPTRDVGLAPEQIVRRCLTIRGIHNYSPRHLASALAFLEAHPALPFDSLVAPWRPLNELEAVLAEPLAPGCLRHGIRPSSE